jgi:hypothetical protein
MRAVETINVGAECQRELLAAQARQLISDARLMGLVVTIELQSPPPLAMGNYEMVPDVRFARKAPD